MGQLETIPLLEEPQAPVPAVEPKPKAWKPSAIAADIATMGAGTLLAGVFNVCLVFVIPKLVSVEDFGYWRMFALYGGYVGLLHFGFADGALLRWAGRPLQEFHHEIGPAISYLLYQHVVVFAPICAVAALFMSGPMRLVLIAVVLYAVIFNITATLQFGLQGARMFRPVAISAIAAPLLFLILVVSWASKTHPTYYEVIGLFLLAWCSPLIFLITRTRPWKTSGAFRGMKTIVLECLRSGWPIVAANTGVNIIQYADRLAVSWAASIQQFAQYSMAASAMAVPITVIQACSKVFFSHLAGVESDGRKRIYGTSSRMLLIAWAVLLPYYFALEIFIHRFLPKYIPSLQYARVLLLAIPFLANLQILQMSYAYLHGSQRKFLIQTVAVLAFTLGLTSFVAFEFGGLRLVAGIQVVILAAWWLFNEVTLKGMTGQGRAAWAKFIGVYLFSAGAYWVTSTPGVELVRALTAYYLCVAIAVLFGCRGELKLLANHCTLPRRVDWI